ncbi:MAG: hypothetical protein LBW77_05370 [Verrucomicrobiota bacterium]|jgi:hypothetical protein|nr:hypothetical protein [Verrucomicrobiota bacterium]
MNPDFTDIHVENILLLSSRAAFLGAKEEQAYCLGLTSLERAEQDEGKTLLVSAGFDLMLNVPDPVCTLECTFAAIYSKPATAAVQWSDFSDGLAVAHMVPFVREFIANVTNRMPLPPLLMKPVNAFVLVEEYKGRMAKKPDDPTGEK